jgi:nicotinamidase-related amidase
MKDDEIQTMVAAIAHFDDIFKYRYFHTYRLHTHAMKALLVIDMQNDFCLPDAILCVKQGMQCLPKVQEAVTICRQKQHYVIWVIRSHDRQGAFSEKLSSTDLQKATVFSYTPLHDSNPPNSTPNTLPFQV